MWLERGHFYCRKGNQVVGAAGSGAGICRRPSLQKRKIAIKEEMRGFYWLSMVENRSSPLKTGKGYSRHLRLKEEGTLKGGRTFRRGGCCSEVQFSCVGGLDRDALKKGRCRKLEENFLRVGSGFLLED